MRACRPADRRAPPRQRSHSAGSARRRRGRYPAIDIEAEPIGQQHTERRQHAQQPRLLVGGLQHDHREPDIRLILGRDVLDQRALLKARAGRRVAAHLPVAILGLHHALRQRRAAEGRQAGRQRGQSSGAAQYRASRADPLLSNRATATGPSPVSMTPMGLSTRPLREVPAPAAWAARYRRNKKGGREAREIRAWKRVLTHHRSGTVQLPWRSRCGLDTF